MKTVTQEKWNSFTEKMSEKSIDTQHNYENGSIMTQKEKINWSVHLETMKSVTRTWCDSHTRVSGSIAIEDSFIDN